MINKVIAVYPGRFQPFGKHHADAFKWLQGKFTKENTYIATSDKVEMPKSPLNFAEKKAIIDKYGFGTNLVQVKNPYKAEEITSKYDPETTALVFMVGDKDMKEDPRFRIGSKKDGSPSYFQMFEPNKPLEPFTKHGYLIVAPHISLKSPNGEEMSGTSIRASLSNPNSTKEDFENIFGWYDPKIEKMIKSKFSKISEQKPLYEIIENKLVLRSILSELLLNEGGTGGHMAHPFDIPSVKTGNDLINVFQKSAKSLQGNPGSVKIDGVNASVRLVNLDGKQQFVMDRGSAKPLDVKGITKDDLLNRFGEGHGMIKVGGEVLDIFNEALPKIKPELKKLGMIDNPNILFNTEYVAGKTNVQEYAENFLAIHGLMEIKNVTEKRRAATEIPYDQNALDTLIKKMAPIAKKHNFNVLGSIEAKVEKQPNFSSELGKSYTVNVDGKKKETRSLKDWLKTTKIPKGTKVTLKDGKSVDALSKGVYMGIKSGKPLNQLLALPKDYDSAIAGFITYLATMQLGDALLKSMGSQLGPVDQQEGVVIRDQSIFEKPFKITGSFIERGLATSF
jgi:hypothetical protein